MNKFEFRSSVKEMFSMLCNGVNFDELPKDYNDLLLNVEPDPNVAGKFTGVSEAQLYHVYETLAGIATFENNHFFTKEVDGIPAVEFCLTMEEFRDAMFALWVDLV